MHWLNELNEGCRALGSQVSVQISEIVSADVQKVSKMTVSLGNYRLCIKIQEGVGGTSLI